MLAFGDTALLRDFQKRPPIPGLDLLIVHDGDHFEGPWPPESDRAIKTGSLTDWDWKQIDADRATYRATKRRVGSDFYADVSTKAAIRLQPSDYMADVARRA